MALEPGRGAAAVPVRSAILGATLAIAALVASLMFWTSLSHLLETPRLSGYTWDLFAASDAAHERVTELRQTLQGIPFHAALKEALVSMDVLTSPQVRAPLRGLTDPERGAVLAMLGDEMRASG